MKSTKHITTDLSLLYAIHFTSVDLNDNDIGVVGQVHTLPSTEFVLTDIKPLTTAILGLPHHIE